MIPLKTPDIEPIWHDGILDEIRLKDAEEARRLINEATNKCLPMEKSSNLMKYLNVILSRELNARFLCRPPKPLEKLGLDIDTARKVLARNFNLMADILIICIKNRYDTRKYLNSLCCDSVTINSLELFQRIYENAKIPRHTIDEFVSNAAVQITKMFKSNDQMEDIRKYTDVFFSILTAILANEPKSLSAGSRNDVESLMFNSKVLSGHEDIYATLQKTILTGSDD
ncbi:hypothetical protein ACOME3_004508 [Neoechinorhynchus agilis]